MGASDYMNKNPLLSVSVSDAEIRTAWRILVTSLNPMQIALELILVTLGSRNHIGQKTQMEGNWTLAPNGEST